MTEPRKKPGVAFWVTVAVVVAVLAYPVSYGPWLYVTARWGNNTRFAAATAWAFVPLSIASHNEPQWLTAPYRNYLSWCIFNGKRDRSA